MIRTIFKPKAAALFIVLGTILIVMILANIILSIMLSQSRLTEHQVSRIQAYYAGLAGMNYALDRIRVNDPGWSFLNPNMFPRIRYICRDCRDCNCTSPNVYEPDLPLGIRQVNITLGDPGEGDDIMAINITVLYNNNTSP